MVRCRTKELVRRSRRKAAGCLSRVTIGRKRSLRFKGNA